MKAGYAILPVAASVGVSFLLCGIGLVPSAAAGDKPIVAAMVTTLPATTGDYEYVGSKKCKKCHLKQHRSWKKTRMGQAFEILKPGQASEAKQKFELDSAKDYTKDESCLGCHTTGHGKPGGYASPDPNDKKAIKKAKKMQGVGCESCHGPGSGYVPVFDEIMKSKRKYSVEELYAVGLRKIDAATCTQCHNDKGPTYDPAKPFDFAKQKDEDRHEQVPLKQREG